MILSVNQNLLFSCRSCWGSLAMNVSLGIDLNTTKVKI